MHLGVQTIRQLTSFAVISMEVLVQVSTHKTSPQHITTRQSHRPGACHADRPSALLQAVSNVTEDPVAEIKKVWCAGLHWPPVWRISCKPVPHTGACLPKGERVGAEHDAPFGGEARVCGG